MEQKLRNKTYYKWREHVDAIKVKKKRKKKKKKILFYILTSQCCELLQSFTFIIYLI